MRLIQKKYGIFGGTFNPPHIAHSIIAREILEQFNLDKIIFIPSGIPPLKLDDELTSSLHRLNMAKIAFENDKSFEVSEIEMQNVSHKSFTVDTLIKLSEIFKEDNVKLYLIIGIDNLIDFPKWKNPDKLFLYCDVIVINRPGFFHNDAASEYTDKVMFAKIPMLEISSTMIRNYIKNGKSIKYFVNPGVEKYIRENKLYLS
jgi:nicotinate-nucleotide adenylyltransferase